MTGPVAEETVEEDLKHPSVGWTIRNAHRLFAQALRPIIASDIPNVSHWYYLRILWEEDGLTQLELSKRVGVSPTTAVPALSAMERQGLIARARDASDRRKVNVYLTPRGRALQRALQPKAKEINARALQGLPEEDIQHFFRVISTICENLLSLPLDKGLDDRSFEDFK